MENVMFNAKDSLIKGVNLISDAVSSTFGPQGLNVLIKSPSGLHITKDGATVAKFVSSDDSYEQMGMDVIREIAMKTAKDIGDGTTSATILAQAIVNILGKEEVHPIILNRALKLDVEKVLSFLNEYKKEITTEEDLIKVATMSVNGDTLLGELIGKTYYKVGKFGVVLVEESSDTQTSVKVSDGVKLESGYHSPYFINTVKNECVLENVNIVYFEKKITTMREITQACTEAINQNRSLLIIAPSVDSSVTMALLKNRDAGKLNSCCITTPGHGVFRTTLLEDLKINTNLYASKVVVSKDSTIVVGKVESTQKEQKIQEIKTILENKELSEFEVNFHKKRLANYIGGIATIYIGGYSSIEIKEKKDRIDDAIAAVKAGYEGGVLPGGGIGLYKAANQLQLNYLNKVLLVPIQVLSKNAGSDLEGIDLNNFWTGKDFRKGVTGDMYELGIIDPYLVTKIALENAVNAASLILTSKCSIISM